jgi:hypothetical protein
VAQALGQRHRLHEETIAGAGKQADEGIHGMFHAKNVR